mgnify:CR=1 FL=1
MGTHWDRLGSLWRSRVALLGAFGSSGLFLVSFWYFFVTRGRKGGTLSPALCVLYVFFGFGVGFVAFSKCFLTRKRGRGRAAGAAEDHSSIQHSLETIALQPFFFLVVLSR